VYQYNVGVVLQDKQGRVLLGKRVGGGWSMPQGDLEPGEDPWMGAKRELYEEVGLSAAQWDRLLSERFTYMMPGGGGKIQYWVTGVWNQVESVRFDLGPYVEFVGHEWVIPEIAVARCVWFKKAVYTKVLERLGLIDGC
jgi:8-oxo-dGTP pyrophosphatase MutT (NUDIX family)